MQVFAAALMTPLVGGGNVCGDILRYLQPLERDEGTSAFNSSPGVQLEGPSSITLRSNAKMHPAQEPGNAEPDHSAVKSAWTYVGTTPLAHTL